MGKPYGKQYFFAGSGCSMGLMVCEKCKEPIHQHNQDWMSYKKSKSYDWRYYCFHRKCLSDQSGWKEIEKAHAKQEEKSDHMKKKIKNLSDDIGVSFDINLVYVVAEAVGVDLDEYFNY